MKIISVALLAGLGIAASALTASASPVLSPMIGNPDTNAGSMLLVQYSGPSRLSATGEYNGRSEARGGSFKPTKKVKKITRH
jgi:hypothetical protein